MNIQKLDNPALHYEWGSPTFIPELLGKPNAEGKPFAEMWMGAHPKAPSFALDGRNAADRGAPLDVAIAADPPGALGARALNATGEQLPFLFKVLAAARPLSIQAHPTAEQAREGFARENRLGIALDAPHRNYRDPNHKPELIVALTPFVALKGFRPAENIVEMFDLVSCEALREEIEMLRERPDRLGLRLFFSALLTLPNDRKRRALAEALSSVPALREQGVARDPALPWVERLGDLFPGDIGALSPLFLNLVELEPGEGLYQPAGELHAYLEGAGVEIMANSDNVLRGGLTNKHVDAAELLRTLTYESGEPEIVRPRQRDNAEFVYETPAQEFRLSYLEIGDLEAGELKRFESDGHPGPRIVLCMEGVARLEGGGGGGELSLKKGESAFIPASVSGYVIDGEAKVYIASTR